jgi:hypothetical protein
MKWLRVITSNGVYGIFLFERRAIFGLRMPSDGKIMLSEGLTQAKRHKKKAARGKGSLLISC